MDASVAQQAMRLFWRPIEVEHRESSAVENGADAVHPIGRRKRSLDLLPLAAVLPTQGRTC